MKGVDVFLHVWQFKTNSNTDVCCLDVQAAPSSCVALVCNQFQAVWKAPAYNVCCVAALLGIVAAGYRSRVAGGSAMTTSVLGCLVQLLLPAVLLVMLASRSC